MKPILFDFRMLIQTERLLIRPPQLGLHLEATLKKNHINQQTQAPSDTFIYALYDLEDLPSLSVHWPTSL